MGEPKVPNTQNKFDGQVNFNDIYPDGLHFNTLSSSGGGIDRFVTPLSAGDGNSGHNVHFNSLSGLTHINQNFNSIDAIEELTTVQRLSATYCPLMSSHSAGGALDGNQRRFDPVNPPAVEEHLRKRNLGF